MTAIYDRFRRSGVSWKRVVQKWPRTRGYFGPTKPGLIKYAIVVSMSAIKASRHVVFTAAGLPGQVRLSLLA